MNPIYRIVGRRSFRRVNKHTFAVQEDHVQLRRSCTVPVVVLSLLSRHRIRVWQRREGGPSDRVVHQPRRAADVQRHPRCTASHSADQRWPPVSAGILSQGGGLWHQCTSEDIAFWCTALFKHFQYLQLKVWLSLTPHFDAVHSW